MLKLKIIKPPGPDIESNRICSHSEIKLIEKYNNTAYFVMSIV